VVSVVDVIGFYAIWGGFESLGATIQYGEALTTCFAKSDFSRNEGSRRPHTEFMQDMAERTARLMNTNSNLIVRFRDRSLRKAQENRKSMILALEIASGMTQNFSIGQKLRLAGVF